MVNSGFLCGCLLRDSQARAHGISQCHQSQRRRKGHRVSKKTLFRANISSCYALGSGNSGATVLRANCIDYSMPGMIDWYKNGASHSTNHPHNGGGGMRE